MEYHLVSTKIVHLRTLVCYEGDSIYSEIYLKVSVNKKFRTYSIEIGISRNNSFLFFRGICAIIVLIPVLSLLPLSYHVRRRLVTMEGTKNKESSWSNGKLLQHSTWITRSTEGNEMGQGWIYSGMVSCSNYWLRYNGCRCGSHFFFIRLLQAMHLQGIFLRATVPKPSSGQQYIW